MGTSDVPKRNSDNIKNSPGKKNKKGDADAYIDAGMGVKKMVSVSKSRS